VEKHNYFQKREYEVEWDSQENSDNQDEEQNDDVEIQNNFYEAEANWKTQPKDAIEKFETVIMLSANTEDIEFAFKAIKYVVILAMVLGQHEKMLKNMTTLLKKSEKVSKNETSEAIQMVIDNIQTNLADKIEL
jgi:hypothetical protein